MKTTTQISFLIICLLASLVAAAGPIDLYLKQVKLPTDIQPATINTIHADSSGFIWLGTKSGLFRWDGLFASEFQLNAENIPKNVTALTEGTDGKIWVGCYDGEIVQLDGRNFTTWKEPDTNFFAKITDIVTDDYNRLWWGTNGSGVFYFDGNKTAHISEEAGLPDNYIYNLVRGSYNEVWASTDNGVVVLKSWEGINEISAYDQSDGLADDIVRIVRKDESGKIWLGFHNGSLCYFDPELKVFSPVELKSDIQPGIINHLEINGSSIWIADDKNGLLYTTTDHPGEFQEVRFSGVFEFQTIKAVQTDKMGNLWMLRNDGLFVSSGGAFSKLNSIGPQSLKDVKALVVLDDGNFITTNGYDLRKVGNGKVEVLLSGFLPELVNITDLEIDPSGLLWIATFGNGILIFDPISQQKRWLKETTDNIINNNVLEVSIGSEEIWLATLGGVSSIKKPADWRSGKYEVSSYNKQNGLGNNFIYQVLQSKSGAVWFATDGNGLVKLDQGKFTFYAEEAGLKNDVVYSLDEDDEGNIWLSTAKDGIYRFDGSRFDPFGIAQGIQGSEIYSLKCQGSYVLAFSDAGLEVIDRENASVITLNEELNIRKLSAELNAIYQHDNAIYCPTSEGIIKVDVQLIEQFRLTPVTVIDRVTVNLEPVLEFNELILEPDQNQLVFEYSGHWYGAPGKVHYSVQLEGYDPGWQTTYDRRISYPNLQPGNYTFKLQAYINQPADGAYLSQSSIVILQPVYSRWWFILLMILAVISLLIVYIRFREKRLKLADARVKEKLEFEFQTLKNQINPHFLFNSFSTLISMIEENPQLAVAYTDKLSDFFRDILEVKDQEVIPMTEELRMLRNYFFIQQNRFGENLRLTVDLDSNCLTTVIPPLTLQLLTENAIKHNVISKNKPLSVTITNDNSSIFVVNNFQPKKETEKSTGLGLKNIIDRYGILKGATVQVATNDKEFRVILPLIR